MKKALFDTPIFLTFFIRHYTLEKTFSVIKEIRPRILFLVGDGPRQNNKDDVENIKKCHEILSEIDWECKIYRFYSSVNKGILENTYNGMEKAFEIVDKLIVLEDDKLPTKSFFYFCEEMLIKYKDDYRVDLICGANILEKHEHIEEDYFFARVRSSGSLAIWKRFFEQIDYSYSFLDNKYNRKVLLKDLPFRMRRNLLKKAIRQGLEHREDGKAKSIELANIINNSIYSNFSIIPKKNLVSEMGITSDSAHSVPGIAMMPRGSRKLATIKSYELSFPLKHPEHMIRDLIYEKKVQRSLAKGYPLVRFYRKIITFLLVTKHMGLMSALEISKNRLKIIINYKSDKNG